MDQYFNKIHWQSQLPFSLDLSKQSVRQSPTVEKSSHTPPALVLGPLLRQDKTAQPTDLEFPSSAKLLAFLSKVSCYYFNSHPFKVAVSNFWQPSWTCYSIPSSQTIWITFMSYFTISQLLYPQFFQKMFAHPYFLLPVSGEDLVTGCLQNLAPLDYFFSCVRPQSISVLLSQTYKFPQLKRIKFLPILPHSYHLSFTILSFSYFLGE